MMSKWKIAVSASALLLLAGCEDRGGADRRAGGTGSSADRQAAGQRASGSQATAQGATMATGQVVSAKSDELVLKQEGQDKELKLKVGPQTQVLIDGKQSTIDNLREGAQVRASYDSSQMATRIEATAGAGGGAADRPGGSAGTTGGLGGASSATPGQTGGPGGESSTSASQPGAPTGTERGSGSGTQPGSR